MHPSISISIITPTITVTHFQHQKNTTRSPCEPFCNVSKAQQFTVGPCSVHKSFMLRSMAKTDIPS